MIFLIKLYLARINGNMYMQLLIVNQLQGCRSGLIVVNNDNWGTVYFGAVRLVLNIIGLLIQVNMGGVTSNFS